MPAVFAAPLPRGLATQAARPDRVLPNANRPGAQGAQEATAPEEDMKRVAAARTTVCYRNLYQAPLNTLAAAAPTHTSTGGNGGRHWWLSCRLNWAREEARAGATATAMQRKGFTLHGNARSLQKSWPSLSQSKRAALLWAVNNTAQRGS
jgi:hypothetical protein